MIMFITGYIENNFYIRIKSLNVLLGEISLCFKFHFVNAMLKHNIFFQQSRYSSIIVCNSFRNFIPTFGVFLIQYYSDTIGWPALGCVENMCRDLTHEKSFSKRNCVILFCSPAAIFISSFGSFGKRSSKLVSISSADFPVAHII